MPFDARRLRGDYPDTGDVNGRWYLAKPIPDPLIWRLRQAWEVVMGRAEIIVWPVEEPRGET